MPVLKYLDPVSGTYKILSGPPQVVDSGWVTLAPVSGTGTIQYRVLGSLFWIRCNLTGLTTVSPGQNANLVAVGGVPVANRPGLMSYYAAANMGGALLGHVVINTDGSIALWNSSATAVTVARFIISYPANGN